MIEIVVYLPSRSDSFSVALASKGSVPVVTITIIPLPPPRHCYMVLAWDRTVTYAESQSHTLRRIRSVFEQNRCIIISLGNLNSESEEERSLDLFTNF